MIVLKYIGDRRNELIQTQLLASKQAMNRTRNAGNKENDHKIGNNKGEIINKLVPLNKQPPQQEYRDVYLRNNKDVKLPTITTLQLKVNPVQDKTIKSVTSPLTNTQQYIHLYAENILNFSAEDNKTLGKFLLHHDIDNQLRGRMLDWLIEVCTSYKFQPKTYFSSVHLMDQYFKMEQDRLPISRLHITGVTAMVIATKMDEVYPLKIKTVYQKIVHKKIQKRQLIEMEGQMFRKLNFCLNMWSFYDLALLKLHSNWPNSNQQILGQIQLLCQHIGKFMVFNYELSGCYPIEVLANSLLHAAFEVYGAAKAQESLGGQLLPLPSDKCLSCAEVIFQTIKSFKANFRSLGNIFKFSEPAILQKVDHFLQNH